MNCILQNRAIPPKNAPPFYKSAFNKGGAFLYGGVFLADPDPRNFSPAAGQKSCF